jgi:hypothetical protein
MSTQTQEPVEMGTKPVQEHQWLQKLVGEWLSKRKWRWGLAYLSTSRKAQKA